MMDRIKVTIKTAVCNSAYLYGKTPVYRQSSRPVDSWERQLMATEGSVYQRKDGRWCAQYRDAKDKVRYIYRKTKQEAKKALREALAVGFPR